MWEQVQQALRESTARVIQGLASLLPGLVVLVLVVVIACAFASVLTFAVRRMLRGVAFDKRLERWGFSGLADWSPSKSPTLLVSRTIWWLVVGTGLLFGITAFDAALMSEFAFRLLRFLPNLLAAILLFGVGTVLARFVGRGVLISAVNHNLQYARMLSLGAKWLVLVLSAAMALEHLGIGGRIVGIAFAILFGGIVLTLSLAIGLGSKDFVSRSIEQQATKVPEEPAEPFRHL
jgi:hypothetical protein